MSVNSVFVVKLSRRVFWATLLHFLCFFPTIDALYSPSGPVKLLSSKQFNEQVINTHDLHLVEFFASWCGHCKSFAPEYEKAAKALRGIADVVAIEDQSVMASYGVQGFPSVKVFVGKGGKQPKVFDYQGARDAASLVDFVTTHLGKLAKARLAGKVDAGSDNKKSGSSSEKKSSDSSDVVDITDSNFEKIVMADEKNVWFVKFYAPWCGHCKVLAPIWDEIATKLKGKVKVGKVDATKERIITSKFGIQGFPTLKLFPTGKKSIALVKDYQGPREAEDLIRYAAEFYSANIEVAQLTDDEQFRNECTKSLCIIAFLPHIYDSKKAGRDAELKILNDIARSSVDLPLNFLWSQGGDQFDLEEQLHLAFGYPAVVAIHYEKEKYAVHRGDFSKESCNAFITQLLSGKAPISALPKLSKLKKADKWDGDDAKPVEITDDEL